MAILLAGCGGTGDPPAAPDPAAAEAERAAQEARGFAEAALGKGSEVLAQGDLPQDGRVQMLVVNRAGKPAAGASPQQGSIRVTRAAVLEQSNGNWSVILLCDEHLKNSNGYLAGSEAVRAAGWNLQYTRDARDGLDLDLTPGGDAPETSGTNRATLDVRWNKKTKRYQTFDKAHERFLTEIPSLETPQSTLR